MDISAERIHELANDPDADLPPITNEQAAATVQLLGGSFPRNAIGGIAVGPVWEQAHRRAEALLREHAPDEIHDDAELNRLTSELYALRRQPRTERER